MKYADGIKISHLIIENLLLIASRTANSAD